MTSSLLRRRRRALPKEHWPTCRVSGCGLATAEDHKTRKPAVHGVCRAHYMLARRHNAALEPAV